VQFNDDDDAKRIVGRYRVTISPMYSIPLQQDKEFLVRRWNW
jgi:hypothetical protein